MAGGARRVPAGRRRAGRGAAEHPLELRFRAGLERLLPATVDRPPHLLIALSGGLDSTLLLYLLRFHGPAEGVRLSAAHFDHRMRASSAGDAAWVRGLCRAWGVPLRSGVASHELANELMAREARYDFLGRVAREVGADAILTAHHADDQAETVLFRVVRGTGIAGLRGIRARTPAGLLRPLLPFWREELDAYARTRGVRWRTDPTNRSDDPARNRLRNRILPEIEHFVAPGARRSLVRLAELAEEAEAGLEVLVRAAFERVVVESGPAILVAREPLREYHPAIAHRVVRRVLRRVGSRTDRIGTRSALQFISHATSGREMGLPGDVRIRIEFGSARVERTRELPEDREFRIEALLPGEKRTGTLRLGGRSMRAELELGRAAGLPAEGEIVLERERFPLVLRARRAGDHFRTRAGERTLKKLLIERRIPRSERPSLPVLADRDGTLLWVAGFGPAWRGPPEPGAMTLRIAVFDEE